MQEINCKLKSFQLFYIGLLKTMKPHFISEKCKKTKHLREVRPNPRKE